MGRGTGTAATGGDDDGDTAGSFEIGEVVVVNGLQRKADFNNRRGRVVGFDTSRQRWLVELDGMPAGSEPGKFKAENLIPKRLVVSDDSDNSGDSDDSEGGQCPRNPCSREHRESCIVCLQACDDLAQGAADRCVCEEMKSQFGMLMGNSDHFRGGRVPHCGPQCMMPFASRWYSGESDEMRWCD